MDSLSEFLELVLAGGVSGFVAAIVTLQVKTVDIIRRVGLLENGACKQKESTDRSVDRIKDTHERSLYHQDGSLVYARDSDFRKQVEKCEGRMNSIIQEVQASLKEVKESYAVEVAMMLKDLRVAIDDLKKLHTKGPFG